MQEPPKAGPDALVRSRNGQIRGSLLSWRTLAWLCALTLFAPVVCVLWEAIVPGHGSDAGSWEHVRANLLWPAMRDTAILVAGVCLFSVLLGVPAAWCISTLQFRGRGLLSVLLVLPLAVPPYVAAFASTEAREAFIPTLVQIRLEMGVDAYLKVELIHRFAWLILIF